MAVINMTFDTVSKELKLDMDGKKIPNVRELTVYTYPDMDSMIEIRSVESFEDDGFIKVTKIVANEIIETVDNSDFTKKIAEALFQRKFK